MEARTLALILQRQQEQKQRRTTKNPCSRWQNITPEGKKRRANRLFMYMMRKAVSQTKCGTSTNTAQEGASAAQLGQRTMLQR